MVSDLRLNLRGTPAPLRFWSRVVKTPTCWIWTGARNPSGHGRFAPHHKNTPAHRYAYEFHRGPIPEGKHLDHLCRTPACVNPWHLEPVGLYENIARSPRSPSVINRNKTHCKRGHEFTAENTHVTVGRSGSLHRACKACAHDRYIAKKTAAA